MAFSATSEEASCQGALFPVSLARAEHSSDNGIAFAQSMLDPIEDLVQRWRRDPSPAATVALCDALRESPRGPLVEQVGEVATQRHASDPPVLVAVARMYVEARRLTDAQSVLVAAAKQAPRDPRVYRWLGEVLLRRGDAERAHKVLERAIHLGATEPDARLWLERARGFMPMQRSEGEIAVAAEVSQAVEPARPRLDSDGPTRVAARPPLRPAPRGPTRPAGASGALPSFAEDEAPTLGPISTAPRLPDRIQRAPAAAPQRLGAPPAPQALSTAGPAMSLPVPHPRDVLDALQLSGLFEPQPALVAGWDRAAPGPKRKGAPTILLGTALFLAAGVGCYFFYRHKRAEEHLQAEGVLAAVEEQLHAGKPDDLADIEKELAHVFRLESRSRRAALDWTRERALVGLVKSGSDVAFEDAMARAKDVGVAEDEYAFARVASFLFQGDTAGAAGVMARWDSPAGADAWYEVVAGATLERAGDARAVQRYAAAEQRDPDLFIASVGVARTTALDGDADRAMGLARALRSKRPDRAEPVALVALAWGRDPMRESMPAPSEVDEVSRRAPELPAGLRFVPPAVSALRALDRHDAEAARAQVISGLASVDSPGVAVWLGAMALALDDEGLARRAALAALQLSAVYEPARALAARVALHSGRLDEALKATEELDSSSAEVAVVRAAAAYERADADGLSRSLEALSSLARKSSIVTALALAPDVLSGRVALDGAKLIAFADDDAPWSDLIGMDIALDTGDLATASKIASSWGKDAEGRGLRALRLARLARYEGRLDAADALSLVAIEHGTVTPRVLWERVFCLVARSRFTEVAPLLGRYPLVLGPLATWLNAYATAAGGNIDAAKGKTASIDPPPSTAPLDARTVAASALAAMKDRKRGTDYVRALLSAGSNNPDAVAAALALGLRRVDHGRRRPPTYE